MSVSLLPLPLYANSEATGEKQRLVLASYDAKKSQQHPAWHENWQGAAAAWEPCGTTAVYLE